MKTYPVYINSEWITSERTAPVVNPANGEPFAAMSIVDRRQVGVALEHAASAFDSWRRTTAFDRARRILRAADELERRADEAARTITGENGKPLAQSRGEVAMTIDHLRWFAEEGRRAYGRVIPHQLEGKRHLVVKTPVGVVGAISPWNFPLVLAVRKVAPALAAGCTVVLKPATATPLSAVLLAECMAAADFPRGVFQLVAGSGREIGGELVANALCRKVSFTGSTEVGRELIRNAAEQVKPLSLELGGNAPLLVFDDADLDQAVEGAMVAKFRNAGQSCIAANRVLVQRSIAGQFIRLLEAKVRALKVGDGMADGVDVGPLIDTAAVEQAERFVADAVAKGAKLIHGGSRVKDQRGYFFTPTLLVEVPKTADCQCREVFAPIMPVGVFDTEEEGIASANDTEYGLAAYAFTRDMARTFRLMESLNAGTIGINDSVPATSIAPFGGVGQSGWGRELGIEGLDAYLATKHISLRMG